MRERKTRRCGEKDKVIVERTTRQSVIGKGGKEEERARCGGQGKTRGQRKRRVRWEDGEEGEIE